MVEDVIWIEKELLINVFINPTAFKNLRAQNRGTNDKIWVISLSICFPYVIIGPLLLLSVCLCFSTNVWLYVLKLSSRKLVVS